MLETSSVITKGGRMAVTRNRIALALLLAAASASALVFFFLFQTSSGRAVAPPTVVPIGKSQLPPNIRDFIRAGAQKDGVDPNSVDEIVSAEAGATRAALVGTGADGQPRVSFFQGFGMTFFQPLGHLFAHGEPLAYSEGFVGPRGAPTQVGIVGAAKARVDHVTIELASGRVVDAPLASSHGLGFFAYTGDTAADFPKVARAYDASGNVVATHEVPST
jgi:hypothetical protein